MDVRKLMGLTAEQDVRMYKAFCEHGHEDYGTYAEYVAAEFDGAPEPKDERHVEHDRISYAELTRRIEESMCPKCMGKGHVSVTIADRRDGTPTNVCFTCYGKGYITGVDRHRNWVYWQRRRPAKVRVQQILTELKAQLDGRS